MAAEHLANGTGTDDERSHQAVGHYSRRGFRATIPAPMTPRLVLMTLWITVGNGVACDNSARNEQIAAVEKKTDEPDDKAVAERKAKREAAEKAKADAADALRAEIAKVAVVPAKLPKGLAEGCDGVADAQDRFVARLQSADAQAKWTAARDKQRPMAIIECTSVDSLEVAGCQIAGLDAAPPALAEHMDGIIDYCVEKFAKPRPAGTLPAGGGEIPKRPK